MEVLLAFVKKIFSTHTYTINRHQRSYQSRHLHTNWKPSKGTSSVHNNACMQTFEMRKRRSLHAHLYITITGNQSLASRSLLAYSFSHYNKQRNDHLFNYVLFLRGGGAATKQRYCCWVPCWWERENVMGCVWGSMGFTVYKLVMSLSTS